ncbi:hypothetical protein FRUB_09127 [Fimbriiglobus ruber]|uniref:Uncharacterized protein n=1 Tax=Fimbriiglobus ruber TaxID=1908690 RepID=A0A225DA76_9BACT|nr:hypothetical protein FRUB_09127 [Fimbriiglobus ruber]
MRRLAPPGDGQSFTGRDCYGQTVHEYPVAAGPLSGQSLVILDPALGLARDVIPCADGHAQERPSWSEPSKG